MKTKNVVILLLTIVILNSCDILNQVKQMETFAKCEFRLNTVQNISLAGVYIQNIKKFSDVNLLDAAKITAALAQGSLPLSLTLNVDVKNPNSTTAAMNKLEWILLIDNIEMVRGINNQRVSVSPNGGISTLPLQITTDLKKVLSGKSSEAMLNFGCNLAGVGNRPTRITLKAKPSIMIANKSIAYPGYITVNNEFGSK